MKPLGLSSRMFLAATLFTMAFPAAVPPATAQPSAVETVLHSFGGPDGAGPLSGVIANSRGIFFGTTAFGGVGAGTVFKLKPTPSGYRENVLHSFLGSDGSNPSGALFRGQGGVLYGDTLDGGNNSCFAGCGVVFKLTPGHSGYVFSVLYKFQGGTDAQQPVGGPVADGQGAVYGVTQFGGDSNLGAVFKLTPGPSGYTESVLYSFPGGPGGYLPQDALTIDKHGNLYGTTYYGGQSSQICLGGCGTVFQLIPTPSGYNESIIYSFSGGSDGSNPYGPLTVDETTGVLYGTTEYGGGACGGNGCGTVFKLTPTDSGYMETVLHSFTGKADGFLPQGKLLLKPNGVLFGAVSLGGGGCNGIGCGSIFKLKPTPSGYSFKVIYQFRDPINGAEPEHSSLIQDAAGALYGTTRSGGSRTDCSDGGPGGVKGCGTLFKLVP